MNTRRNNLGWAIKDVLPHKCGVPQESGIPYPGGSEQIRRAFPRRFAMAFLLVSALICSAQPKSGLRLPPPLDPVEAEHKGRALVADLLAQKPAQNSTNTGLMKIRNAEGSRREISITFEIRSESDDWLNLYQTSPSQNIPGEKLEIVHSDSRPNQYVLLKSTAGASSASPQKLTGDQTMIPFAGSDFWVADLGLEFLHWPRQ